MPSESLTVARSEIDAGAVKVPLPCARTSVIVGALFAGGVGVVGVVGVVVAALTVTDTGIERVAAPSLSVATAVSE